NDLDPDKILDCLKKLKIVAIELRETSENEGEAKEQEENPQDIFESINSTGKDLCEAVLIKNRILANVKNTSEQEYIFSTYCQSISMFLQQKDKRLELFFRHYLIMKTHSHISEDEIYKEFKSYWMENIETHSVTDLCEDILTFAKHYQEITFCDAKDEKLNALYREIAALEHTVCYPFILKLLGDNEKGLLSKEQLYEIIKLCISYMFRLNMCAKMINDLGEIFIDLIEHVCANQCRAVPLDYLICVKEFFAQLNNRKKFPDDKQFQDIFCQKNIYSSKKRCKYILEQLETFENKQAPKVSEMSVEHIVPQNLSKEWIIALDKDVNKIKAQYLHTIGNLTLSAYNSHLSDKLFKEKLNADPGGFKVSGLRINKYIVNQKTWKLKQIQERSKELSDLACKVWPYHNIASGSISATQKFTPSSASLVPSSMPNQILFEAIDERIMQLHKNRIIRDFKNIKNPEFEYIDKKTNIRFAKVCPMKTKVNIFAAISPVKVNDPKRMCKDSKKLPSNYPIRIDMRDIELIDDALEIIKQAL
ncbi:MAG: HNH endonuclease family protein, partial [Elusimicrobiota bacterium]|nr:HNH endonuclease family protein [Elusimicrobiota bacterium]